MRILRIYVALFLTFIVTPPILMLLPFGQIYPIEENRALEPPPQPFGLLPRPAVAINKWFDDHYGLRDSFIRIKNEVDYQFFKTSDKVWIGRNNWLFQKDLVRLTNEIKPKQALNGVRWLKQCLRGTGIRLAVVLDPYKASIYPEELPASITMNDRARRLARLLAQEDGIIFVDGLALAEKHKQEDIFYKTDLHLTWRGGQIVFGDLVARIAQASHGPIPALRPLNVVNVRYRSGSAARFMSKIVPVWEYIRFPSRPVDLFTDDGFGRWTIRRPTASGPASSAPVFDWIYRSKRPASELLPDHCRFWHFGHGLCFSSAGYHEIFKAIYRSKSNEPSRIVPLLRNLPADTKYFVLEFPEPFWNIAGSLADIGKCPNKAE